mmetsp:Transcript_69529/g.224957  ORF Transcript_69529/g.224957 Transcript_69529/m.224957 type:complete len:388 (-) Transcript_69529:1432-2595(-)
MPRRDRWVRLQGLLEGGARHAEHVAGLEHHEGPQVGLVDAQHHRGAEVAAGAIGLDHHALLLERGPAEVHDVQGAAGLPLPRYRLAWEEGPALAVEPQQHPELGVEGAEKGQGGDSGRRGPLQVLHHEIRKVLLCVGEPLQDRERLLLRDLPHGADLLSLDGRGPGLRDPEHRQLAAHAPGAKDAHPRHPLGVEALAAEAVDLRGVVLGDGQRLRVAHEDAGPPRDHDEHGVAPLPLLDDDVAGDVDAVHGGGAELVDEGGVRLREERRGLQHAHEGRARVGLLVEVLLAQGPRVHAGRHAGLLEGHHQHLLALLREELQAPHDDAPVQHLDVAGRAGHDARGPLRGEAEHRHLAEGVAAVQLGHHALPGPHDVHGALVQHVHAPVV